jgi:predicted DNA-binding transcriptional regulator YafY
VNPKTIQRDITYLRDQLGAPLEYDPLRNGYYYLEPDYHLPFPIVTEGELVALLLTRQIFAQFRGTPFERDLRRALSRLSELLPESVSIQLDTRGDCLSVLPSIEVDYDPEIFATLAKAALEHRRIDVVYHTADRDEMTERALDPYALLFRDESWYVVARDSRRNDIRVFAVQRFRSARDTGERFERPADFRVNDYLSGCFGLIRGSDHHRVALRFHPPTAIRIAERTWHPGQTIQSAPDGSIVLRFEVSDLREVKRFVFYWGADCEVLEPEELRKAIVLELERMLDFHL